MEDNKAFVAVLGMLFAAITVVVISCVALCTYNSRRMAEFGYQQEVVPGHQGPVWRKAEQNE